MEKRTSLDVAGITGKRAVEEIVPSVMAPAKAQRTRAARRDSKVVAFADQIIVAKKRKIATRKAGRLPK